MSPYQNLADVFATIQRFEHALTILNWDQEVMMPAGGADSRSEAVAELSALIHQKKCLPELKQWLDEAASQSDLDPEQSANLREMKRHWQDANLLPEALVREQSIAQSRCQHQWRSQRSNNDWAGFAVNLKTVVELERQRANIRQQALGSATAYDALLSLYSHGDGSELIGEVFCEIKQALPDMIRSAVDRQRSQTRPKVKGPFAVAAQRQLSEKVMAFLGFNFERGRLDVSTHPFSTGNFGDQRITTRYSETDFVEALYATIHETGHARYEAGLPEKWQSQPLGSARNMSIHESQSLFFEKHIGASRAFCDFLAQQANGVLRLPAPMTAGEFQCMVKWVEPGLIRVNADELTYPLHIVLRFEIESALINGAMEVDDIPTAWNDKMQAYLGLSTGKDYCNGCMQDIHWTMGAFGYFPSYTLGAVNAAQLRSAMEKAIGPIDDIVARGNIQPIADWLGGNIWQHGSLFESQELMIKATGKQTHARALLDHFQARYFG